MTRLAKGKLLPEIKKVDKMKRREYLKYYIKVLEENISEAKKVLAQKKKELKNLKR